MEYYSKQVWSLSTRIHIKIHTQQGVNRDENFCLFAFSLSSVNFLFGCLKITVAEKANDQAIMVQLHWKGLNHSDIVLKWSPLRSSNKPAEKEQKKLKMQGKLGRKVLFFCQAS